MLSGIIKRNRGLPSYRQRQAVATVLLSFCFALIVNITLSWAHGDEDHDELNEAALSTEQQKVVASLKNYAAAVQSGKMEEVERYVVTDDNFSSIEGTYVDLGWASYRDHLGPEMGMFKNASFEYREIRPFVRGDMAYATMSYEMSLTIMSDQFEGGEHHVQTKGRASMVLVQIESEWKIQHMHTARQRGEDTTTSGH